MVKEHKRSHPKKRGPIQIKKYPHRVYPARKKGKVVVTLKDGLYPRDVEVRSYHRGGGKPKVKFLGKPKHKKGAKKHKTGKRTKYQTAAWMAKIRKKAHKKRK